MEIGLLIKEIRKDKKMTLKDLSAKTDLSISFLSQLERAKSSVTLESLKKISLALGVNPGVFFEEVGSDELTMKEVLIERTGEQGEQFTYKDLSSGILNPSFSPMFIKLEPGENKGDSFSHPGQEFLYVLKGELTVEIDNEIQKLTPHESIMFDSSKRHYWYNYTDENVEFLCVAYDA